MKAFWQRKKIDLELYKDQETLLKAFQIYGCTLKQVGKQPAYICLSPFSKERTPSCRIQSIKKGKNGKPLWGYKDFSSGSGGDIFTLVMKKQGVDFRTAIWIVVKRIAANKDSFKYVDPMQVQIIFPAATPEEFISINFPF